MKKENWNYVLNFQGIDYDKPIADKGPEHFIEKRYFDTLHDAFNSLIQTDIRQFDTNILDYSGSKKHYYFAEISIPDDKDPVLWMVKIPIDDSPDAAPVAGIYLNTEMGLADFGHQSGFNFTKFATYDPGFPFLLLGKYVYDDQGLNLIPDPAFEEMQANTKISNDIDADDIEWSYKTHITMRHFEDDLTHSLHHNTHKKGALVSDEIFHYEHPEDAFADLISLQMYALDEKIAFNKGLGHYIERAAISTRTNKDLVSLESITEIRNEARIYENGIYIKFYQPVWEFEKLAQVDLSCLDNYSKHIQYQQILQFTTDRNELLTTNGYNDLVRKSWPENADYIINQYPSVAPYTLKIEWDFAKQEPLEGFSSYVRYGELSFVSYDEALKSLCELDDRAFNQQQACNLGNLLYIKHATIYDTTDNKPIISKFMTQGNAHGLPDGVYIKLNGEKTTVEILHAALERLPSIQQAGEFHFLVSQPVITPVSTMHVKQEDTNTTTALRKKFPWYKKGPSL